MTNTLKNRCKIGGVIRILENNPVNSIRDTINSTNILIFFRTSEITEMKGV